MRKIAVILLSVLLCLLFININCFAEEHSEKPTLNISFDSRIELLGTIVILSDFVKNSNNCAVLNTVYKMNLIKYFTPYKDHLVIENYELLSKSKISISDFEEILLSLSPPPELKIKHSISDVIIEKAGGIENINKFLDLVRSFSNESSYIIFFNSQNELFGSILESVKKNITNNSLIEELENYYGSTQDSYNIMLSPLLLFQIDSFIFTNDNMNKDLYAVFGLSSIRNGFLLFGSNEDYRNLYLNKWSYAFIDPIINKYNDDIDDLSYLFDNIEKKMNKLNIYNWRDCLTEHIVRSIAIRISEKNNIITDTEKIIEECCEDGFIYLNSILKSLKHFETERSIYLDLDKFFPEILKNLSNLIIYRIIKFFKQFFLFKLS